MNYPGKASPALAASGNDAVTLIPFQGIKTNEATSQATADQLDAGLNKNIRLERIEQTIMAAPAPRNIKQIDESTLGISWNDGHDSVYSVKNLRESCPCANCIDEWSGKKLIAPDSITDDIRPKNLKAVGLYAIQFYWSDGHDTGLYTHELLRQLCECSTCKSKSAEN